MTDKLNEKHIGFKKLKAKIAAKGGVSNPAAVAASIGFKKYGKKKMEAGAHHGHAVKEQADKMVHGENVSLLDAVFQQKPLEFNQAFTNQMLDRIRALVDARRVEHGKEYFDQIPVAEDEVNELSKDTLGGLNK